MNKIREAIKERSGGVCEWCNSRRAEQMHHITKRSQGGIDTEDNLIHLCFLCHTAFHNDVELIRLSRGKTFDELRGKHDD